MVVNPGQILVNYSDSRVRLFFRIYFILIGTVIGPLGKACSSARVKLQLLNGKDVKLPKMMGWLSGLDCITTTWKLRAFPSGFLLTLLMLVAYFVSIASDLVGSYIRGVKVHDQCTFGTGLVLSHSTNVSLVPWNDYSYTIASQAQLTSLENDGQQGIYAKVNGNTSFSAGDSDIVGAWKCTQNAVQLDYPNTELFADILNDLVSHNLLYNTQTVTAFGSNVTGVAEHLVLIDTSNDAVYGVPWDVRICLSTVITDPSIYTMLSFQCVLEDKTGWVTNILKDIQTSQTIPDWIQSIQGSCYSGSGTPARPDLASIFERTFNTMTMIAGGRNYLLNTSQSTATQGCLTNRILILWEVIALAILAALLILFLLLYLLFLTTMQRKYKKADAYPITTERRIITRKELEYVPGDLLGWTSQAMQESKIGPHTGGQREITRTKAKELKDWTFGWSDLDNRFGVLGKDARADEVRLLVQNTK